MPDNIRSFQYEGKTFDIPEAEVQSFLSDVPDAKEVKSFVVGKDTLDIPQAEVDMFKMDVPEAKPLRNYNFSTVQPGADTIKAPGFNPSDTVRSANTVQEQDPAWDKELAGQNKGGGFWNGLINLHRKAYKAAVGTILAPVVGQGMLKAPKMIADLSELPTKLIINRLIDSEAEEKGWNQDQVQQLKSANENLSLSANSVAGKELANSEASKWLTQKGKQYEKESQVSDKSILDLIGQGDVGTAAAKIAVEISRSLPYTLTALMGGGAGLVAMGLTTASAEYDDIKDSDSSQVAKLTDAITNGTAEALGEYIGTAQIGKFLGQGFKTFGAAKQSAAIKNGLEAFMSKVFKKYGIWATSTAEGVSEWATTIAQNAAAKFTGIDPERNIMDGTGDSFIVGFAQGGLMTGGGKFVQKGIRTYKTNQFSNQLNQQIAAITHPTGNIVQAQLNNQTQSPVFIVSGNMADSNSQLFVVDPANPTGEKAIVSAQDLVPESISSITAKEYYDANMADYRMQWDQLEQGLDTQRATTQAQQQVQNGETVTPEQQGLLANQFQAGQTVMTPQGAGVIVDLQPDKITVRPLAGLQNESVKNFDPIKPELVRAVTPEEEQQIAQGKEPSFNTPQNETATNTGEGANPAKTTPKSQASTINIGSREKPEIARVITDTDGTMRIDKEFESQDSANKIAETLSQQPKIKAKYNVTVEEIDTDPNNDFSDFVYKVVFTPKVAKNVNNSKSETGNVNQNNGLHTEDQKGLTSKTSQKNEESKQQTEKSLQNESKGGKPDVGNSTATDGAMEGDGQKPNLEGNNAELAQKEVINENITPEGNEIVKAIESKGYAVEHYKDSKGNDKVKIVNTAKVNSILATGNSLQEAYDKSKALRPGLFIDNEQANKTNNTPTNGKAEGKASPDSSGDQQSGTQAAGTGDRGTEAKGEREKGEEVIPSFEDWYSQIHFYKSGKVDSYVLPDGTKGIGKKDNIDWFKNRYEKKYGQQPTVDQQIINQEVNQNPTEGQKEAGNYKKAHITVQGMNITIENPVGSVRSGKDEDGKAWEHVQKSHYGYFKQTEGKDGDQIDTYVGTNPDSQRVFVIDQVHPKTGAFDESKVMLGYNSEGEARQAYLENFDKDWKGLGNITESNIEDFKKWLYDGARQRKPYAEYKEVKVNLPLGVPETQQNGSKGEVNLPAKPIEYKGITSDEFILLDITKSFRPAYRKQYLIKWNILDKFQDLKESLKRKGLMSAQGGITQKGIDLVKSIKGDGIVQTYYQGYDKMIAEHWSGKEKESTPGSFPGESKAKHIGKNSDGNNVFDDVNGNRYYTSGGVRSSAPVAIIPGHGYQISTPEELYRSGHTQYLSAEEVAQFDAKHKPQKPQKEPWQMTRDEYATHQEPGKYKGIESVLGTTPTIVDGNKLKEHREVVLQAISEGKPVPLDVMKDYPELKTDKWKRETAKKESDDFVKTHIIVGRPGLTPNSPEPITTVFAKDDAMAAIERLKAKLGGKPGQVGEPEATYSKPVRLSMQDMQDGTIAAGFFIESGNQKFADYSRSMVDAIGDGIKPYLKSLYESIRRWPDMEEHAKKMDSTAFVDGVDIEEVLKPAIENKHDAEVFWSAMVNEVGNDHRLIENVMNSDPQNARIAIKNALENTTSILVHKFVKDGNPNIARSGMKFKDELIKVATEEIYNKIRPEQGEVIPPDGWRGHLIKSRSYAKDLMTTEELAQARTEGMDWSDQKSIEKFIDEKLNNSPENVLNSNIESKQNGSNSNIERSTGNSENGMDEGQSSGTPDGNLQPERGTGEGTFEGDQTSQDIASGTNTPGQDGQIPDTGNGDERSLSGRGNGTEGNGEPNIGKPSATNDRISGLTPDQQNHVIKPEDSIVPNGETAKIRTNIKAIKLAKTLEKKNKNATPAEKKVLAQYVGWGGLAPIFKNETWNKAWSDKYGEFYKELKELLTPEELRAAKESTINAHYTDRKVIDAMWKMVERMGFKGGRILEPAGGVGHFFGLMPESISSKSQLRGVELDKISGLIFSKLYPQARIDVSGFEEMHDANNSYDLTISNVPFAGIHVHDSLNKDISKEFTLHNYFIAKSIRLLKPGGIGAFITTSSTMDNEGQGAKFRAWVNSPDGGNADLIDAIRLPNNAFKENAGTEVTTDILFFRKRNGSLKSPFAKNFLVNGDYGEAKGQDKVIKGRYWNESDKTVPGKTITIRVNEFFLDHPDRMLGQMRLAYEVGSGGLYNPDQPTLFAPKGLNVTEKLNEIAETTPKDIFEVKDTEEKPTAYAEQGQSEGELVTKGGKPYIVSYGELTEPDWNDNLVTGVNDKTKYTKAQVIDRYNEVKKILKSLVVAESTIESTDEEIEKIRKELNTKYDKYKSDLGNIDENRKTLFLRDDVDYSLVSSLENSEQVAKKDKDGITRFEIEIKKADIFTKRMNHPREEPRIAGNIDDALDISFAYRNELDLDYMSKLTGIDVETIRKDLLQRELAYENPLTGIIEDKDNYLSGYVRKKLKQAETALEKDSKFKANVEALRRVIPKDIPLLQIQAQLGASWINPKIVQKWIKDVINIDVPVFYNNVTDRWSLNVPHSAQWNVKNTTEHSAGGQDALSLIESALNQQLVTVYDRISNGSGGYNQVKNEQSTAAAQGKVKEFKNMFQEAIWDLKGDEATNVIRSYNDLHNAWVNKTVTISDKFTHFPGASKQIKLNPHQVIGVKKGLAGSTMLAHQVGVGKTFELITIAMEMKRLGLAKKPMIVVQKATTSQFVASFRTLYPGAKILVPSKKDLEASERKKLFAKIALNEWDAVIIYHDFLTKIPDKPDRQIAYINERIDELEQVSADEEVPAFGKTDNQKAIEKLQAELADIQAKDEEYRNPTVKDNARRAISTRTKLQRQFDRKTDKVLYFEDMGVDALLVDEAHTFKRLGLVTKGGSVKGIDTSGSQKSVSAKLKTRYILENNNQKNVIFATGTPISNTMAEAYTMMNYLIPERLKDHGIKTFDDFRTTFGSVDPSLEFTAAGKFKFVDRFAKYINLPELQRLWQSVADVVLTEEVPNLKAGVGTPLLKDGKPTMFYLKMTKALENKMEEFKETLQRWDNLTGKEKRNLRHIPLVVFNLAKRAAIDVRLVDSNAPDDPGSKTNKVVSEIKRIYDESNSYNGTQLVFCDMIQSSDERFNLHEDIKNKLIKEYHIPASQIQLISDHDSDSKREKLFEKVNNGEVRVVIGSTDKLGIGVNVQERLRAIHHIDAPARPMDYEQRNGRLLRQGNLHLNMGIPVEILTYGVEKTLDATAYQRLDIKQKFIHQMMKKGISIDRVLEEDDEDIAGATFAQMMANLSGSQYAILHISESLKLQQAEMDKRNFQRKQIDAQDELRQNLYRIEREKTRIEEAKENIKFFDENLPVHELTSIQFGKTGKVITKDIYKFMDEIAAEVATSTTKNIIINGKIQAAIKYEHEVMWGEKEPTTQMKLSIKTDLVDPFDTSGWNNYKTSHGLLKKAFEKIDELVPEIPQREKLIEKYLEDNKIFEKILSEKYPKQDNLDKLKARVAELETKMQEETSGVVANKEKIIKTDDLTSIKEVAAMPNLNLDFEAAKFLYENQNDIETTSPKFEDIKIGNKYLYDYDDSLVEIVEVNTEDRQVTVKSEGSEPFILIASDLNNEFLIKPLIAKGLINDDDFKLTKDGQRFIDLVDKRKQTRLFANYGLDLFPETTNIPEITGQEVDYTGVDFVEEPKPTYGKPKNVQDWIEKGGKYGKQVSLGKTKGMDNKTVGKVFANIIEKVDEADRNNPDYDNSYNVDALLYNWNESELNEDRDNIKRYVGRDGFYSRGQDGGAQRVSKKAFIEWLQSEEPFNEKTYGKDMHTDKEWVKAIETAREAIREITGETKKNYPSTEQSSEKSGIFGVNEKKRTYKTQKGETIQYSLFSDTNDGTGTSDLQRKSNSVQSPSLRKLNFGERSAVELKYTLDKNFVFDGRNKIESTDDIAYLFRKLEDKAVENMFACLVIDGKPTIIHLSMGGRAGTVMDFGVLADVVSRFKPEKLYLLHNHPSGNLDPSEADIRIHKQAIEAFGDIVQEHVLINIKSGLYATFKYGRSDHYILDRPQSVQGRYGQSTQFEKPKNYKVIKFDKQVFTDDTTLPRKITSSREVASFLSAQRYTEGQKLCAIITNRQNGINAYLHLSSVDFKTGEGIKELAKELIAYQGRFGGHGVILFGQKVDLNDSQSLRGLNSLRETLKRTDLNLLDYLSVSTHPKGYYDTGYDSMADDGLLEPNVEYGGDGMVHDSGPRIQPKRSDFNTWDDYFKQAKVWQDKQGSFMLKAPRGSEFSNPLDLSKAQADFLKYKNDWQKSHPQPMTSGLKDNIVQKVVQRMLPVEKLQSEVIRRGGKIYSNMDAVVEENESQSKGAYQIEQFDKLHTEPIVKALGKLAKKLGKDINESLDQIGDYVMAKHAPERNRFYREQAAKEGAKAVDKITDEELTLRMEMAENKGSYTGIHDIDFFRDWLRDRTEKVLLKRLQKRDFARMTEWMGDEIKLGKYTGKANVDEFADAKAREFEAKFTKADTDNLWNEVRAINKFVLDRYLSDSRITLETYRELTKRWNYYVPMRGWEDATAGDVFNFEPPAVSGAISEALKTVKGGKSKADNPFGYMVSMAHSAIVEGNKNRIMLNVLNMARENQKGNEDLFAIKVIYKVNLAPKGQPATWVETLDVPDQKLWDEGRVRKSTQSPETFISTPIQLKAGEVVAVENGLRIVVGFSDPQVAYALTGVNNKNVDPAIKQIQAGLGNLTRWISSNWTTRSPWFLFSNTQIDLAFAEMAHLIEKDGNFIGFNKALPGAANSIRKSVWGKLSPKYSSLGNPLNMDAYLIEWKDNGGETGFTHLKNVEKIKKNITKLIKRLNEPVIIQGARSTIGFAGKQVVNLSQWSEDLARFATYVAARKAGLDPKMAAYKGKQITVNFNTKGEWSSAFGMFYSFFNVGWQSLRRNVNIFRDNAKNAIIAASSLAAMGFLGAVAGAMWGDDDDEGNSLYYSLSDYDRYNKINIPVGKGFIQFTVPHFFRAFYAMGVMTHEIIAGRAPADEIMAKMLLNTTSSFSPINMVGNQVSENGDIYIATFTPTMAVPFVNVARNKGTYGEMIYKEPYIPDLDGVLPPHKMAMPYVNPALKKLSEKWNGVLGGSDQIAASYTFDPETKTWKHKTYPAIVNFNPSTVEYIAQYIGGGRLKFWNQTYKFVSGAITGEEIKNMGTVPFWKEPRATVNVAKTYYALKDQYGTQQTLSATQKKDTPLPEFFNKYYQPKLGPTQKIFRTADKQIDAIKDQMLAPEVTRERIKSVMERTIKQIKTINTPKK